MSCAVNPFTGREAELSLARAARATRVVVIGGGPGGLEAARVAALRGHRVALYEREPRLGGAFAWACVVHPENGPLLDFLVGEVRRLGVEVHRGTALDGETALGLGADALVVATGGRLVTPEIPGDALPHVVSGARLRGLAGPLSGRLGPAALRALSRLWMPLGRRVAIVGADLAAVELAEFLAERGRRVALLEAGDEIAPEVGLKRRTEHMDRLDRLGVRVHTGASAERITREAVHLAGGAAIAADAVVLAGRLEAETALYDALRERAPEVHAVGDCTGLGLARKAVLEGARAACAL